MHLPKLLGQRFELALGELTDQPQTYAAMIRSTNDPKFGDYQANFAMPLSKSLPESNPRQLAATIIERVEIDDICESPEIAGPGFINLRLKDTFLLEQLRQMLVDDRCLVAEAKPKRRMVVDFSSPNVAKPMHVGHIRSTVIGDALARTLRFMGHQVITDNHLGDWGTQFGIIIYGYKHFGDAETVAQNPVPELAKLYRLTNQLIEYRKALRSIEQLSDKIAAADVELKTAATAVDQCQDPKEKKKASKRLASIEAKSSGLQLQLQSAQEKVQAVQSDPVLIQQANDHPNITDDVLHETLRLHQGDEENLGLWQQFLPHCKDEINRVYNRLDVRFDHTLGESFYHSMLESTVRDLQERGLARESDGAVCVFSSEFEAPMIIRKKDGAFLYATTDLATLTYRLEQFKPDEILYVVDSRQSEHFDKLFAVAKQIGMENVKLVHVNFGTVLGEDGRPMKTRSGVLIGLESLLLEAISEARKVACDPERLARIEPPMDEQEQQQVAETVGIGAIKYADLSHHRTSDYSFSPKKMVSIVGNTSAYIQYSVARTEGILRKADRENQAITEIHSEVVGFSHPAERSLVMMLLRMEEVLSAVHQDYAPNFLVDYLYETAKAYSVFNDNCPVLKAENDQSASLRLALVALTGRVLRLGLSLLGIKSVARM